jgi:hypothetical protein
VCNRIIASEDGICPHCAVTFTFFRILCRDGQERFFVEYRSGARYSQSPDQVTFEGLRGLTRDYVALDWGKVRDGLKSADEWSIAIALPKETHDLLFDPEED